MALGFDKKVFLSHIYWRIRIKLNGKREGAKHPTHLIYLQGYGAFWSIPWHEKNLQKYIKQNIIFHLW